MQENTIKIRFVKGLCSGKTAELLGKIAHESKTPCELIISEVETSDIDTLQDMVTSSAIYVSDDLYGRILEGTATAELVLLKKLCVAVRYAISGFKMTVDYGAGEQQTDCTLSIKVKNGHIHLPLDVPDKRLERFVSGAIETLGVKNTDDELLVYYDSASLKTVCETKDEYVRRKYFDSGAVTDSEQQ